MMWTMPSDGPVEFRGSREARLQTRSPTTTWSFGLEWQNGHVGQGLYIGMFWHGSTWATVRAVRRGRGPFPKEAVE